MAGNRGQGTGGGGNKDNTEFTTNKVVIELPFKRIILTGFRATGKSLTGRILAENTGLNFLDTDTLFVEKTGLSVAEYVGKYGWDKFREEEEKLLFSLRGLDRVVIATGGGAILHERAWSALRGSNESICIWLRAEVATIIKRLAGDDCSQQQRPSLTGMDFQAEVRSLVKQRQPLYDNGSDMSFETDKLSPPQLAVKIEEAIAGFRG